MDAPTTPKSPRPTSPTASEPLTPGVIEALASLMTADHWRSQPLYEEEPQNDAGSMVSEQGSTSAMLTDSILAYREINGRTYHTERGTAHYFGANDERASELLDMHHQLQLMCTKNKLYMAPLDKNNVKTILDIGTGTGIWAIDIGVELPDAEVIGTDVSAIQPSWVPPNVRFEIEDCGQDWSFPDNSFDYVHIRYLVGAVMDWRHLLHEAYRVCRPGGWIETAEALSHERVSDGTVRPGMATWDWSQLFIAWGRKVGRSFEVLEEKLQERYLREAGCVDMAEWNLTIPIGPWPEDLEMNEIGRFAYATFAPDLEGFLALPAMELLGWGPEEVSAFCSHMRREIRSREVHFAFEWKAVWGRKPLEELDGSGYQSAFASGDEGDEAMDLS